MRKINLKDVKNVVLHLLETDFETNSVEIKRFLNDIGFESSYDEIEKFMMLLYKELNLDIHNNGTFNIYSINTYPFLELSLFIKGAGCS